MKEIYPSVMPGNGYSSVGHFGRSAAAHTPQQWGSSPGFHRDISHHAHIQKGLSSRSFFRSVVRLLQPFVLHNRSVVRPFGDWEELGLGVGIQITIHRVAYHR